MAFSLVGSGGNSTFDGGVNGATLPVGTAENDIVVVAYAIGQNNNANHNLAPTTAGYTEEADLFSNDTRDSELWVGYKVMGAVPDGNFSFPATGNAFDATSCAFNVWRGQSLTSPLDAATTTDDANTNSAVPNPPAITTVTPGALVLIVGCGTGSSHDTAVTVPTNYSNQQLEGITDSSAPNAITLAMASRVLSAAGAEDPAAWTGWTTSVSDSWCAATVALRPLAQSRPTFRSPTRFFPRGARRWEGFMLSPSQGRSRPRAPDLHGRFGTRRRSGLLVPPKPNAYRRAG